MGAVAKSYMRKRFLICEEMRKYLAIYEEALVIYDLATAPCWISFYMRKILFSFLSVFGTTTYAMEIHVRVPLGHALPALVSYYSLLMNVCDFTAKIFFSWSNMRGSLLLFNTLCLCYTSCRSFFNLCCFTCVV
jgi:hypothetical protein